MSPKTALLVIDMQVFFESMTPRALPNILCLCKHFSQSQTPIIFTQHGHSQDELTTDPSPSQLVRKWGPADSIAAGSDGWKLIDELHPFLPSAYTGKTSSSATVVPLGQSLPAATSVEFPKVVSKNTYDGFLNTSLAAVLEVAEIERVVVCGVMTDCCVDTTARSAFNRGYETWLVKDASSSANRAQHEAGLRGFSFAFGEVLSTDEVLARL
ncbi:hypothetical protein A1O3_04976 [Capronia epimyces CBS 606.96]|uniref:Isochorismatase-like domain-containing protein n=1 Tax=Capronia epimyces CBS 606.96 TaxID=1182542 RepID=W9YPX7_9EURO|nr:uncharacterized protein A1O3_04976 [Capronia epimyces CBS 606.96]EXJ84309.1 hypothetical protein A1O3_04976 [Capronia epimyces CBS 606.96]